MLSLRHTGRRIILKLGSAVYIAVCFRCGYRDCIMRSRKVRSHWNTKSASAANNSSGGKKSSEGSGLSGPQKLPLRRVVLYKFWGLTFSA